MRCQTWRTWDYILQPHTSAGRIPSDAGYRLYVDRMMEEKDREVTEMKELVLQRQDKMELLLKQMVKVLAANTNYAAMISGPQYHRTKLKFIQLSVVNETVSFLQRSLQKETSSRTGFSILSTDLTMKTVLETEYPAEQRTERSDDRRDQSWD